MEEVDAKNVEVLDEMPPGLGQLYPFPVMFPGSDMAYPPSKGFGLCDDEMWDSRTGAMYWRGYTAYIKLTRDGGTLALGLAAGQQIDFFTAGQDQLAPAAANYPAAYTLTNSDTEAYQDGALVRNEKAKFLIYAFGFYMGRPAAVDTLTRVVSPWHTGYIGKIRDALPGMMGISVRWPDTKCEYDLGTLPEWGSHSAVVGEMQQIGAGEGFSQIAPVRRPILAGYRTTEDRVTIRLKNGMALRIDNDVAFPTTTDLYVPIRCMAYGIEACEDPCIVCVSDSVDVRKIVEEETRRVLAGRSQRRQLAAARSKR